MNLQEAIRFMMKMPLDEAGSSCITRPDNCSSNLKLGFDPLNSGGGTGDCMVIYDAADPARFMKDHCAWVSLRLDEILADDWVIVKDND